MNPVDIPIFEDKTRVPGNFRIGFPFESNHGCAAKSCLDVDAAEGLEVDGGRQQAREAAEESPALGAMRGGRCCSVWALSE